MAKSVLITGSSGGIGANIAQKLSKNRYKVFLTGRNEEKLIQQAKIIQAEGFLGRNLCDDDFLNKLYNSAQKNSRKY